MQVKGYDIIGDVHGCGEQLRSRLEELGYRRASSSDPYRHPERIAVFVGDLIDRGGEQRLVLETVKAMVDAGTAKIVMGNHEFNAIAYATEDPDRPGSFLRPHDESNEEQHQAFLWQLSASEREHYVAWFKTLPLWLDLGTIRVVHACWHKDSIKVLEPHLHQGRFASRAAFVRATRKPEEGEAKDELYAAAEILTKGPETELAQYGASSFKDKDGKVRTAARVRWWDPEATTLGRAVEITRGSEAQSWRQANHEHLEKPLSERDRSFVYKGKAPVFYGHYWRSDEPHELEDWTAKTACVDFSAVRGGTLVAYRWSKKDGARIKPERYHPMSGVVGARPSA